MPFVKFTENRVVDDRHKGTAQEVRFKAGEVYELPFESCMRWKKRGVAVDATPEEEKLVVNKATESKSTRPARLSLKTETKSEPRSEPKAAEVKSVPEVEAKPEPKPEAKLADDEVIRKVARQAAAEGAAFAVKAVDAMPADAVKPVAHSITIPADWRNMGWPKMKVLASYFTPDGVHSRPDAIKIIEAELERRGKL